jgi:hypothetical protein
MFKFCLTRALQKLRFTEFVVTSTFSSSKRLAKVVGVAHKTEGFVRGVRVSLQRNFADAKLRQPTTTFGQPSDKQRQPSVTLTVTVTVTALAHQPSVGSLLLHR